MKKVMIVDDDATSLAIVKALLEDHYVVETKKSGLQALGYLKEHRDVDIILLDMIMPGTSGMDVLKALKRDEQLRAIPVIFLTSMGGMEFEREGFTSGASDFIQKPVHVDLLKLKIERQLYIVNLRRENQELTQQLQTLRKRIDGIFEEVLDKKIIR